MITRAERDQNVAVALRLLTDNLQAQVNDAGSEFGSWKLATEIDFASSTSTLLEELAIQLEARGVSSSGLLDASTALASRASSMDAPTDDDCDCDHDLERHADFGCRMIIPSELNDGSTEACPCRFQTGLVHGSRVALLSKLHQAQNEAGY